MTNILEQVARSSAANRFRHFRPSTTQDFFALRLASRLGESSIARHYADLMGQYSEGQLLAAYRRALMAHVDLSRRFHQEIESLSEGSSSGENRGRLAAIRIDRRVVAVAILDGEHLQFADARQLSSSPDKALASTISFITRRVVEKFQFESAALEVIPNGHEVQRRSLHQAAIRTLGAKGIGILELSKRELLAGFGWPPPRFRKDVRQIASDIYPVLDQESGGPWTHDAAALGLYVQTERLFNSINQSLP